MRTRNAALELTVVTVLVITLSVAGFTVLSLRWQRTRMLDEVARGMVLASDTLHSGLRHSMLQNQRGAIAGVVERVANDTRIASVRILEHRGTIKFSTDPTEVNQRQERTAPACVGCHGDDGKAQPVHPAQQLELASTSKAVERSGIMNVFTPILAEAGCVTQSCHQGDASSGVLGVVELGFSLQRVEADLRANQLRLSGVAATIVLFGGLLLWLGLSRRFHRPMRDVLAGIRRIASGDLSHRIPARVPDEFGELARSFNKMSQQLKTIQQGMVSSERLISMGKLAAGVAHEINNPLTGILSYAEDMLEDTPEDAPLREDLEVIVHEAMRCRKIVRSLLDFARQDKLSLARIPPTKPLDHATDVVARQASFRNVQFERDIEPDLPLIEVDAVQIQQVLINLIINAQQAMPEGGKITLGIKSDAKRGQISYTVRDEGHGMSPEVQQQIFEPFFSTKGGVTDGLGLAVCHGIVTQHQGDIEVESRAGEGTTFRIVLPISPAGGPDGDEGREQ